MAVGEDTGGIEGQGGEGRQEYIVKVPKTDRKERVISKKSHQAQKKSQRKSIPPKTPKEQKENAEGR